MTANIHTEDVPRMASYLLGVVGALDATALTAPTDLHLGFDHDWISHPIRSRHRLIHRVGDPTGRHWDAKAGEVLLALVLEEIHMSKIITKGVLIPAATPSRGRPANACGDGAPSSARLGRC